MERGDLDQHQAGHPLDECLHIEVDVGRELPRCDRGSADRGQVDLAAGAGDAHALQHQLRLVLRDRPFEGDVPGGEPHEVVARLVLESRFVVGVGLDQAAIEVGDRRAGDVIVEVPLEVRHDRVPEEGAEALDGADTGEDRHDRLANTGVEQMAGLLDIRIVLGEGRQINAQQLGAGVGVACLPGLDGRGSVQGSRRSIGAGGVEAAVAVPTVGHEWFESVVSGQQL